MFPTQVRELRCWQLPSGRSFFSPRVGQHEKSIAPGVAETCHSFRESSDILIQWKQRAPVVCVISVLIPPNFPMTGRLERRCLQRLASGKAQSFTGIK